MSDLSVRTLDPREQTYDANDPNVGALDQPDSVDAAPSQGGALDVQPQVLDEMKYAAPASAIARASLATDTPTRIKRYSKSLGIPESDFSTQDGNIIRKLGEGDLPPQLQGGNLYGRVEPSVRTGEGFADTAERLGDYAASGAGPAIPAIAGGGAAILTAPSMGGSIAAGGGAAGVAEVGRQALDKGLAGEDESNFDWKNVLGQTALGAIQPVVGGLVGKGAAMLSTPLQGAAKVADWALGKLGIGTATKIDDLAAPAAEFLKSFTNENPLDLTAPAWNRLRGSLTPQALADMQELRANAARNGVDLSLDQLTGNYSLFQRMRQLMRYPETSNDVYQFGQNQRIDQVPTAFMNKVNELLPAGSKMAPEDMIAAFRQGSDSVVQKALKARSEEAATNFGMALDDNPQRFWTPALDDLFKRPSMQAGIANAKKIAAEEGIDRLNVPTFENGTRVDDSIAPDWRAWDYIRKGVKAEIDSHTDPVTGTVDAYGRAATGTYRNLMGTLYKENPQYGLAMAKYGDASDATNMILEGGPGFLRNMKGMDRQQIVDRVFSGQNMMAGDVAKMRQNFVDAGAGDQWDAGVHAFLRGKLDDALTPLKSGGQPGNVAGSLFQNAWGGPEQQRVVSAALGDGAKADEYSKFMNVIQAASKFAAEGSPTATDLGPGKSAAGSTLRHVSKLFDVSTYTNLGTTVGDGLANMFDRNYRTKMLDYMLTPQGSDMISQMAKIKPSSLAARQLLGQAFVQAGVAKAGARNDVGIPPMQPILDQ